jgi:hypothetical protein
MVSSKTPKSLSAPVPSDKCFPAPVDARPAPWADDDRAYFRTHRDVCERLRLPFPNEFPACCVLEPGRAAYVNIIVERDASSGQPRRARRRLCFCRSGAA